MNNQCLFTLLLLFLLVIGLNGCIQEPVNNLNDLNPDGFHTAEKLTDADWEYFVFHYMSGQDLHRLFKTGLDIIDEGLSLYNPVNSSFLIKITNINKENLSQLNRISHTMNSNISRYQTILENNTVSNQMKSHALQQSRLFEAYENLSLIFQSIFDKIQSSVDLSDIPEHPPTYISISEEMMSLFFNDDLISDIMNVQVDLIVEISDELWDEWTQDRDWSFMDS